MPVNARANSAYLGINLRNSPWRSRANSAYLGINLRPMSRLYSWASFPFQPSMILGPKALTMLWLCSVRLFCWPNFPTASTTLPMSTKKLFPPIMAHDPPGEKSDESLEAGLGFRFAVLVECTGAFDIARQFLHLAGELLQRLGQRTVDGRCESFPGLSLERAAFHILPKLLDRRERLLKLLLRRGELLGHLTHRLIVHS